MTTSYTISAWSLADLFPGQDSDEMKAAFAELESQANAFEAQRERLSAAMDPEDLLEIVQQYEKLNRIAYRIYNYASLSFAANTQDQAVQAFLGQVEQFMAKLENQTLFFGLWWKSLEEEEAVSE